MIQKVINIYISVRCQVFYKQSIVFPFLQYIASYRSGICRENKLCGYGKWKVQVFAGAFWSTEKM